MGFIQDPPRYLALGVIEQAVCDAREPGGKDARKWLRSGNRDLRFWCDAAGIDFEALRERVKELPMKKVRD